MAHKRSRRLQLGEHVTLIFEDETTVRYQVQEMLRAERIFEDAAIREELDAYNPMVPDGRNWKATMMIEYPDPEARARELARLIGIEDRVWMAAGGAGRVFALADEDLDRENEQKTSAVHFLRFELTPAMTAAVKAGAAMAAGIDHPAYRTEMEVPAEVRGSLARDLA
jgi:precorrin-3B methylase